jgi:hypothetical protein
MRRVQYVAAAAAAAAAILYFLIGFGVLNIGTGADGPSKDLLGFGVTAGAAFAVVAVLPLLVPRRFLLILIALFDAAVITVYFVVAEIREPPVELWGVLIKAFQVVLLGAVVFMIIRGPQRQHVKRQVEARTSLQA